MSQPTNIIKKNVSFILDLKWSLYFLTNIFYIKPDSCAIRFPEDAVANQEHLILCQHNPTKGEKTIKLKILKETTTIKLTGS